MTGDAARAGLLVTLDGPGGVGKSTTAAQLVGLLTERGHRVHATAQPSATGLGQFIRSGVDAYRGRALACLVAADRYHQQRTEIRPALVSGRIVVCDRYVAASYVLQRMDGVNVEFLDALNNAVDRPDVAVILTADPAVTSARIDRRGTRHRFEAGLESATRESELYLEAVDRLTALGYPVMSIDAAAASPEQVAGHIAARVEQRLAERMGGYVEGPGGV